MNINDRQFNLSLLGKTLKHLDGKFGTLFSYFSDLKESLNRLGLKTHNVKITNPVSIENQKDYAGQIKEVYACLEKIERGLVELKEKEPVSIENKEVDLSELAGNLKDIETAVKSVKIPETDLSSLLAELKRVREEIAAIPQPVFKQEKVTIPDKFSLKESGEIIAQIKLVKEAVGQIKIPTPKSEKTDLNPLLEGLKSIEESIQKIKFPETEFPKSISVDNFPPTKIPQPVTNININPLRGLVHTTATTVGTTLKAIPDYGVLDNRRSMIIYNNSSTVTVYLGGSDVTASNGIPLDPKSFSPAFDSGPRQVWYGITSSGTAELRCVEIANDSGL